MPQHHIGQSVDAVKFMAQLDTSNKVKIPKSGTVIVRTKNSEYEYDVTKHRIRGGILGTEWRPGRFVGTTFGGSMIQMGVLIPGALLEFGVANDEGYDDVYNTSPIMSIEILDQ